MFDLKFRSVVKIHPKMKLLQALRPYELCQFSGVPFFLSPSFQYYYGDSVRNRTKVGLHCRCPVSRLGAAVHHLTILLVQLMYLNSWSVCM